jgi:hypothetical protein
MKSFKILIELKMNGNNEEEIRKNLRELIVYNKIIEENIEFSLNDFIIDFKIEEK